MKVRRQVEEFDALLAVTSLLDFDSDFSLLLDSEFGFASLFEESPLPESLSFALLSVGLAFLFPPLTPLPFLESFLA